MVDIRLMKNTSRILLVIQAVTVMALAVFAWRTESKLRVQRNLTDYLVDAQSNHWELSNQVMMDNHKSVTKDIEQDFKIRTIAEYLGTRSDSN